MVEPSLRFVRLTSAAAVAAEAARRLSLAARAAIAARGELKCVLAGGRTPLAAYGLLAERDEDWARWRLFLGDERCLPPDDPERNSHAIATVWTERVGIPRSRLHWIPAELGAVPAATRYDDLIRGHAPFDLILLGMGEDGHTASLFPGQALASTAWVVPVHGAPKSPAERVTLTPTALAAAPERLVLVTGADKRAALAAWRAGEDLPVARVAATGPTLVLMDVEAAPEGPG